MDFRVKFETRGQLQRTFEAVMCGKKFQKFFSNFEFELLLFFFKSSLGVTKKDLTVMRIPILFP